MTNLRDLLRDLVLNVIDNEKLPEEEKVDIEDLIEEAIQEINRRLIGMDI